MRRQEELRRLEELRNQELQKRKQIQLRYIFMDLVIEPTEYRNEDGLPVILRYVK